LFTLLVLPVLYIYFTHNRYAQIEEASVPART
jgi:hypothetical protein